MTEPSFEEKRQRHSTAVANWNKQAKNQKKDPKNDDAGGGGSSAPVAKGPQPPKPQPPKRGASGAA